VRGCEARPEYPCPHSTGSGCDDYENRPKDICVGFQCGWITKGSPLPNWMKPNNAKVIVIFDKLQWQGYQVDLALPVGWRVPPRALKWLQSFAQQQGRPLLYPEQMRRPGGFTGKQDVFGFGPPEFQVWISHCEKTGQKLW